MIKIHKLLFYVTGLQNKKNTELFFNFLNNFKSKIKCEIYIFCENKIDKDNIIKFFPNVININEDFKVSNNPLKYPIDYTYLNIEKNPYDKNYYAQKYNFFYRKLSIFLDENNINFAIINFGQGILNSLGAYILNNILIRKNIKIFFPMTNSPLNGRFMIYDNIFLFSKELNLNYTLKIKQTSYNHNKTENFINKYIVNEYNIKKRKNKFESSNYKKYLKVSNVLNYFKIFILQKFFSKNIKKHKNKQPFALLLLTKTDSHWFTNYSNSNLCDRNLVIKDIIRYLPSNFNLVIKVHPRIKFELKIEKLLKQYSNVYISYEDHYTNSLISLIKSCEFVIGYGTTGLIIPLLFKKHVIDIGIKSAYFNMDQPPVFRAIDTSIFPQAFNFCLNNPVSNKKIYSYFSALMFTTCSFNKDEDITHFSDYETCIDISDKIILKIKLDS